MNISLCIRLWIFVLFEELITLPGVGRKTANVVSGHRISTTEVESALVSHEAVAEAAVVGAADAMTGQGIVAFVILRGGIAHASGEALVTELRNHVTKEIGAI